LPLALLPERSIAWSPHPEDEELRVIGRVKNNLAPRTKKQATYRVKSWDQDPDIPVIEWQNIVEIDIEELLKKPDSRLDAPARDEAKEAIKAILIAGSVPAEKAVVELKRAQVAEKTWKRAKSDLGVRSRAVYKKGGFQIDYWEWYLPGQ
jgi:hypothetical protein